MTYGEAVDVIKAYQKKYLEDKRFQAMTIYRLGELVTKGVGIAFGSKQAFPQMREVFPGLFEEPKKQQWQIAKERIEDYAARKRKQAGGEIG